jgi:hypothetical protein
MSLCKGFIDPLLNFLQQIYRSIRQTEENLTAIEKIARRTTGAKGSYPI